MDREALIGQAQALGQSGTAFLKDGWSWWSTEMRSILPGSIRRALNDRRQTLLISVRGRNATACVLNGDAPTQLGSFPLQVPDSTDDEGPDRIENRLPPTPAACIVNLPADRALQRELQFPLATEERLGDVIGFEMDRLTPFGVGDVYFDYAVTKRDKAAQKIDVQLTVARKSDVEATVERLEERGIRPTAVSVFDDAVDPEAINDGQVPNNLLPDERRARPFRKARVLSFLLPTLVAVLVLAAAALPIVMERQTVAQLERLTGEVSAAANAAADTRDAIRMSRDQAEFFAARRAQSPTMLAVLNEVSRIVPDDTVLLRFQVSENKLLLQGESTNASSLIGILEGSDAFRNAAFSSPLTNNPRSKRDRFSLEAQVVARGEAP